MALNTEEVLEGLAELITDETGIDAGEVALEKSFTDDLDIDSISMMTIVVNAEEKFGVTIPDDEVKNLKTVGDAVTFITSNSNALGAAGDTRAPRLIVIIWSKETTNDQAHRRHWYRRIVGNRRYRGRELEEPPRGCLRNANTDARLG
jgi:acyl carrier protein